MPFMVRTPKQSEPKSIADFLNAGHPWMALVIALSWLWRPVMIVFALLALRLFWPSDNGHILPGSTAHRARQCPR